MQEVKAITHQVQVASLVSAIVPTFAYVRDSSLRAMKLAMEQYIITYVCVDPHI